MLKWLERAMPHAGVEANNPLFKYEVRRIPRAQTIKQLYIYGLRVLMSVLIVTGCLWLLLVKPSSNLLVSRAYSLLEANGEFIGILLVVGIVADIIFDFACVASVLNLIEDERERKRWDLLKLSPIYPKGIVDAKYVIAQVVSWRILAILIGIRVAVTTLVFLHMILLAHYETNDAQYYYHFVIISHLLFLFYIVEPLWRMRALIAIGLSVSARTHNTVCAILTYARMISSFEIIRIIIMALIAIQWLWNIRSGDIENVVLTVLCSPPLTLAFGIVSYFIYRELKKWGIQQAIHHFSSVN